MTLISIKISFKINYKIVCSLISSDHIKTGNQKSVLRSKFRELADLCIKMLDEDYHKRPNCQHIIDIREKWALKECEFNCNQELKVLLSINNENRSYVQNIIITKLTEFIERPINMCRIF